MCGASAARECRHPGSKSLLGSAFAFDTITRVPKGEFGGDVLHRVVMNQTGAVCGTILWESKRTKTWSDGWLAKLRQDQRAAKADIAVIVSQALPSSDSSSSSCTSPCSCCEPCSALRRSSSICRCIDWIT